MEDLAGMMGKPSQVRTVFLAGNRLRHCTTLDIKNLNNVIIASSDNKLALVIEIKGCYEALLLCRLEHLGK